MADVFSELEKAAITAGVSYLKAHKSDLVSEGLSLGGSSLDKLVGAAKKLEPTHGAAVLVEPVINSFLDSLDANEKAALPTQLDELIQFFIDKGTAIVATL